LSLNESFSLNYLFPFFQLVVIKHIFLSVQPFSYLHL